MFKGLSEDDVPVLYQINGLNKDGYYYIKLDNPGYSLFPYEQEVLFGTGTTFLIIDIS